MEPPREGTSGRQRQLAMSCTRLLSFSASHPPLGSPGHQRWARSSLKNCQKELFGKGSYYGTIVIAKDANTLRICQQETVFAGDGPATGENAVQPLKGRASDAAWPGGRLQNAPQSEGVHSCGGVPPRYRWAWDTGPASQDTESAKRGVGVPGG